MNVCYNINIFITLSAEVKNMDKIQFNKLDILEQIEYVNSELANGLSLRSISSNLGISKTTIRGRFEKLNYYFNAKQKQYINMLQDKLNDNIINKGNSIEENTITKNEDNSIMFNEQHKVTQVKHNHNMTNIFDDSKITALMDLIEMKDALVELVKNKEQQSNIVIDVPEITIKSERLQGEVKTRSYNIYEGVIKEFSDFCNEHKQFTQKDLLSMAIIEYIDRYNR